MVLRPVRPGSLLMVTVMGMILLDVTRGEFTFTLSREETLEKVLLSLHAYFYISSDLMSVPRVSWSEQFFFFFFFSSSHSLR